MEVELLTVAPTYSSPTPVRLLPPGRPSKSFKICKINLQKEGRNLLDVIKDTIYKILNL